jgi:HK97 gp10 family phage protein
MLKFEVSDDAIRVRIGHINVALAAELTRALTKEAADLARYVKERKLSGQVLKNRTGTLRRSVFSTNAAVSGMRIEATVGVGREAPYGEMLEKGTPPHTIRARNKKVLRFQGTQDGETVYRKEVSHPGTKPKPFLRPSLAENKDRIIEAIRAALVKATGAA